MACSGPLINVRTNCWRVALNFYMIAKRRYEVNRSGERRRIDLHGLVSAKQDEWYAGRRFCF